MNGFSLKMSNRYLSKKRLIDLIYTIEMLALIIISIIIIAAAMYYWAENYQNTPNIRRTVTLYYTNWCKFCKIMKPVWQQVKDRAAHSGIVFVEIDGDKQKTPGVTSYPTIMMIVDGKSYKYGGKADYQQLWRFVMNIKPEYVLN